MGGEDPPSESRTRAKQHFDRLLDAYSHRRADGEINHGIFPESKQEPSAMRMVRGKERIGQQTEVEPPPQETVAPYTLERVCDPLRSNQG